MAPYRMFKGFTSEGGIKVPAFVHYPRRFAGGTTTDALAHVMDIAPTLLEMVGVAEPAGEFKGRRVEVIQGKSMLPVLDGRADQLRSTEDYLGWEIYGKRAIRQGDWKIVWEAPHVTWWNSEALGISRDRWQLYNLARDPAELDDLAATEPERLQRMIALWDEYARENGVIIPDRQRAY
jgi:arylsulfatase